MNIISALILGLVQGFSEFLPISSSGHLVIFQNLLKFQQPGVMFDTVLHAGTTLAVIWFYRKHLMHIKLKTLVLLGVGTIPAAVAGFLFKDQIEALFTSTKIVGFALLITAAMNYSTDKQTGRRENMDIFDSIVVGLAQALAIIPGVSRSGSTIFAATQMNIDRSKAAEFSFLLSIPAIIGANILEIALHGAADGTPLSVYVVGLVAAFVAGLFAIHLVIDFLLSKKFKVFAYYAFVIGVISIILL